MVNKFLLFYMLAYISFSLKPDLDDSIIQDEKYGIKEDILIKKQNKK
jgi:hypothetical protein